MMKPIMTVEEWALAWLKGQVLGVRRGRVSQAQLQGSVRRVLSWGIDAGKVAAVVERQ